jgi:hypothetical protein
MLASLVLPCQSWALSMRELQAGLQAGRSYSVDAEGSTGPLYCRCIVGRSWCCKGSVRSP